MVIINKDVFEFSGVEEVVYFVLFVVIKQVYIVFGLGELSGSGLSVDEFVFIVGFKKVKG